MADLPDVEASYNMKMAIAWEIAKNIKYESGDSPTVHIRKQTNSFIQVFNAINNSVLLPDQFTLTGADSNQG